MVLPLSYYNVDAMFLYKLATYNKYRKSLVANTNVSETLKILYWWYYLSSFTFKHFIYLDTQYRVMY